MYDKLTGATNNQISNVLGAKQPPSDYPIDHYQQQQAGQQTQQFNQLPGVPAPTQDDFFTNIHRQPVPPPGFPAHSMPPPLPSPHLGHLRPSTIGHHPMQLPDNLMTTQPPNRQQSRLGMRPLSANQVGSPMVDQQPPVDSQPVDSLPSASSLNNNGARLGNNHQNATSPQQQQQQQQQLAQLNQQPIYYTPPIFAYNNFDQNRPLSEPQVSGPFAFPHQQQPPLGLPEQPMSIDEYNARQARLRQLNQQLNQGISNEVPQVDRYLTGKPSTTNQGALVEPNLLAEPQQQQRHKQQMLDRQLLFGGPSPPTDTHRSNNVSQTGYYPDPALYRSQMSSGPMATSIRPPYAHSIGPSNTGQAELGNELVSLKQSPAQNRIPAPLSNHRMEAPGKLVYDNRLTIKGPPNAPSNQLMASAQQPQFSSGGSSQPSTPQCALRQQQALANLELANSSSQLPALFCNEDPDYPTKEIMRALENYGSERPVEQILPQLLVQLHLAQRGAATSSGDRNNLVLGGIQRQLTLDSLQPSISELRLRQPDEPNQLNTYDSNSDQPQQVAPQQLFPSANYEPMCRSSIYMAQPRRAKNLIGQWKVVVNLPGHKYRGTAVSQMVRVEECSRPNSECAAPPGQVSNLRGQAGQSGPSLLPKSRCLQHYENQRMVAWSSQQGIHVDIFRVPIACSCHIRR